MRAAAAILTALAAAGILSAGSQPPAVAVAAPAGAALATIGAAPIGLSVEYPLLERDMGSGSCPPASFVAALRGLGAPVLRIGGDSQDQTAPAKAPPHAGASDLERGFWSRLSCLERQTSLPVVVGINLASGEPGWAAQIAAGARSAVPAGRLRFELGNEPDIYGARVPWWNGSALVRTPMPFAVYLSRARAARARLGRHAQLEGPDFASGRWVAQVPSLIRALGLNAIDAHFYPLAACSSDQKVSAAELLSRAVQAKIFERISLVREAAAAHLPALVSEANSVSCGGVAGVSDGPAAAVWGVRAVLEALRAGFSSIRFHSSGGRYDPFTVAGSTVTARPLYQALEAIDPLLVRGAHLEWIPGAHALNGMALVSPRTTFLSNYTSAAVWVSVPARGTANVVTVADSAAVVSRSSLRSSGGRVRIELPPNSLVAIRAQPAAST
ncbi:MAG TPA: hypothetical protein VHX66_16185 [Solirubrobacteraceae bacterium]|nr:hypothetical protein [Solirubrobacteraceae bacterium]